MTLLATDLDGTLLLPDGTASPRVRSALAAARSADIEIVVLTARSWRSARRIVPSEAANARLVCSNGAVVYDIATQDVVRTHHFEADVVRAFMDRARAHDVAFAWETAARAFRTQRYNALADDAHINDDYRASLELADDLDPEHRVTKLLMRHESMTADELLAALTPLADSVSLTISGGPFVEAMAPGITKAATLARLCEELGVTAGEVVAVGDHTNDLPMLRWAGRGVAMGNAHPTVLAEIAEHTAPNTEDGLALVIESLL